MAQAGPLKVGVVGCGMICPSYLDQTRPFSQMRIVSLADRDMARAESLAASHGVPNACTVAELMADRSIDIVLNLTTPQSHAAVTVQALRTGKHVYSEKPLAATVAEARQIRAVARKKGLRVGCAPDTFMGCHTQTARKLIDDGAIGQPTSAIGSIQLGPPEGWHNDPESFYAQGGGPMFDVGSYILTVLVALLGPVHRVAGATRVSSPKRTVLRGPRSGTVFGVSTPTHVAGVAVFRNGAVATLATSFDVYGHHGYSLTIHGTEGSLTIPDPSEYGETGRGPLCLFRRERGAWEPVSCTHGYRSKTHGLGLADMAQAILSGRAHRANDRMAFHVLEVMQAFMDSSRQGRHIGIRSSCDRPAAMPQGLRDGELD